ncbi:MAG TPA: NADH-quinone oxidoreductase subunit NuoG [Actinomycetota bacterium]|nr:NADH-quinone oxidoreductase subunit NuoG [Actinomycetota bacterium]
MTSGNEVVNVTINGLETKAEPGRLLIDVAEELGIFVPRFCYHPGMKSVAVCRMCLVHIEGSNKLLPACATPVAGGMVANTVEESAVDAQEGMLEFLLINHPLDCPICDRAGECPLQDQTYAHGPGTSRYIEPKRTYEKALEISELVVLDRERCVLCWRCVRFSDEIAGDQFIQLVDRGPGTQILTFSDEPFDSYFSGNTIQICPVGALTSKPYRFVARPWDLKAAPSVCSYCAVGCPLTNEVRTDEVVRCQALPNEQVNDFWSCDKGRFGYHYVDADDRLTNPLVRDGEEFIPSSWADAFDKIAAAVEGKERIGVISGGHLTTEDSFGIARLARDVLKTSNVDSRIQDAGAPYDRVLEVAPVAGSTAQIADLAKARTVVWIGPDPKETLPVLYLKLRHAVLECNTKLIVVSPRATSLDRCATHVVRSTDSLSTDAAIVNDIGDPLVVCWGPASPGEDHSASFDAARALVAKRGAKLLVCPPHAGSQGAIDMGVLPSLGPGYEQRQEAGLDTRAMLEAAAAGELDALFVFGADLITDFPDAGLARRALGSGVFTVVVELLPTETVSHADVVLPSAAYAERTATFTNLERRLQKLEPVKAPPGTARQPWEICAGLAARLGDDWEWLSFDDVWADIKKQVPTHKDVDLAAISQRIPESTLQYESQFENDAQQGDAAVAGPGGQYPKGFRQGFPIQTGQNWPLSWELRAFEARQRPGYVPPLPDGGDGASASAPASSSSSPQRGDGSFRLLTGRLIYDEGNMVSRSVALRSIQRKPYLEMNDEDAKELELADGDEVVVGANGTQTTLAVAISDIARGSVFIPYDQEGLRANTLMAGVDPHVEVRRP